MPIAYRIDLSLGLTVACWDGIVTEQDTIDYMLLLAADAHWPAARSLADLSTVTDFALPAPDVAFELIDNSPDIDRLDPTFAVVRPQHASGLSLEDAAGSFIVTLKLFDNLTSACSHLDVDREVVSAIVAELRQELRCRSA